MVETYTLDDLLREADLQRYGEAMRKILRLRDAADIIYVDEKDLCGIGMSRPEQKRLKAVHLQMYPKGSIIHRLKKILGKNEMKKKECSANDQDQQHVIPLERIVLCKELGKGEFGSVFQAIWKNNVSSDTERVHVAVKCVPSEKLLAGRSNFLQEAAIMHKMHHDHIVRLYGVVLDTKAVMLVSEFAPCGSLLSCLQNPSLKKSLFVERLHDYALQVAYGMEYLSCKRLIHRDLAARNVLVFNVNKIKISDFGLSRSLGMGEDYYRSEFSENIKLPIAWCAPESINFLRFTTASDVWSYAVTLFEIFSYGKMPWACLTGAQILSAIEDPVQRRLECPDSCPVDIYKLMLRCWAHEPEERPTFADIARSLPDLQPQVLTTIRTCNDGVIDHLQYSKNAIITVLDRAPSAYPDGYYWRGCLRNGQTGLFRPDETVAKLGAENPSSRFTHSSFLVTEGGLGAEKDKAKRKAKREKPIISEPQGDLRHMCHIGADGSCFGSLQTDKSDSVHIHPSAIKPFIPIISSPCPSSMISPERSTQPSPSPSSYSFCGTRSDGIFIEKSMSKKTLLSESRTSSPPLTRPKPSKLSPVMPTSEAVESPNATCETVLTNSDHCFTENEERNEANEPKFCSKNDQLEEDKQLLSSTTSNVTEGMPTKCMDIPEAISQQNISSVDPSFGSGYDNVAFTRSICRMMSQDELRRWEGKASREHKKADKELMSDRRKEQFMWKDISSESHECHESSIPGTYSQACGGTQAPDNWTEDAQNAYKVLVQCGDALQNEIFTPSSFHHTEISNALLDHQRTSSTAKEQLDSDEATSPLRQLRSSRGSVAHNFRRGLLSIGKVSRIPPPVPPKPLKKRGFAESRCTPE